MVMYRIELEKLTKKEKQAIIEALKQSSGINASKSSFLFLMSEMNRMYKRELYKESDISCRDCVNNIISFWKINSIKWSV